VTIMLPLFFCLGGVSRGDTPYAGGTRADYDRAAALRERFSDKVFRDRVEPQWIEGASAFWYRVTTGPGTHEFILVETGTGARRPAFDHDRLAAALAEAGVEGLNAAALPLEKLAFTWTDAPVAQFQFDLGGRRWRCHADTYALESLGEVEEESLPAIAPDRAPDRSTRTGAETQVIFENRTGAEVELFWLDTQGDRRSYGRLQPDEHQAQHTYAGHIWLAVDSEGRTVAVYEAAPQRARALIGVPSPAPPRRARRDAADSSISPDGRWRAFLREHNIWLRDRQTEEEFALSRDGTDGDHYLAAVHWSPDSQKLAAVRRVPAQERRMHTIESSPRDQLQPKLHSTSYLKPGDRVAIDRPQLFDIETRTQIPVSDALFTNPYHITRLRWQPDSRRFTFVFNQRGHQALRVVAVDSATGAATAVIDESSDTFINYSGKFFLEPVDETGELIWMSERDGWNHLYLYDAETGAVKNQITRGPWVVRGVEHIDKENRQIWFRLGGYYPEQDPYYVHHARVNFDGTGLTLLTESDGTHTVQYSPDRRYLVAEWSRVDHPPVHELRRAYDGALVTVLEEADASALRATGWQAPEPFVAKGRDGETDIHGVLIRPTDFDPARRYPVIEYIYAGPQSAFAPKGFRPHYQMMNMAELGFILVQIDGMGTSYRSKAFHDVCWQNLADSGLPDRVKWIRAAAETRPYMDIERVGIYGGSAGGQNAAAAVMTHGDFYQVAVADCGCHDNRMDKMWWNEQWMGWPVGPHYEANSNVTLAPGLQGKLMLIVGELDTNVDPASTMQVVDALIRADKDFDLLVMTGTGHGAAERPYASRRRADFFVRHLLGVEPRR